MNRPRLDLLTTGSVLKQSSRSFLSNFIAFLLVSLFFLAFRIALERGTLLLSSFLEQQTSFHSLFPPNSDSSHPYSGEPPESAARKAGAARRSFVIFTRGGTLDDDFFADESFDAKNGASVFGITADGGYPNVSRFLNRPLLGNAKLEFPQEASEGAEGLSDQKILAGDDLVVAVVGSGSFIMVGDVFDDDDDGSNRTRSAFFERNRPGGIRFYDQHGVLLDQADAAVLIFLIVGMSAAFGWLLLGYLFLHSCSYGVVFFTVLSGHLGKRNSMITSFRVGCRLGINRLTVFILLRWAFREVLTQILSLFFFSSVSDEYTLVRLVMRLKLMPFSVAIPLTKEMAKGGDLSLRIWGFLFAWFLIEALISFAQNLDCWVALTEPRTSVLNAVVRGCRLTSVMWSKAICIKMLELVFCGLGARLVLSGFGGDLFAMFFQSMAQTFFLVAWLVFYFAARSSCVIDSHQWGYRELEDCLEALR
ncbi:uncharacterized protein LOC116253605 [Nymphaea colorata]|uniref:uncharacterized protein LOC116253605 n=1 Tax=Nymphaea colorata TaxID=210225 RepID=UPI00129EF003|nr:uncharacterized protein LOC116253605 [Nymphaea colorata]